MLKATDLSHFYQSVAKLSDVLFTHDVHIFCRKLISENQSGVKSSESCANQLLAITHEIFSSYDNNYEVGRVFGVFKSFR